MKNWIIFFLTFFSFSLLAQTEGVIKYKESIALQIDLPEGMEAFASQIPASHEVNHLLFFDEESALFKIDKEQENQKTVEAGSEEVGMQMIMDFDVPDNVVFCNLQESTSVEKLDFMGKTFLIPGDMKKHQWKITSEHKSILERPCIKATVQKDSVLVVAWFAPSIPVSVGPSRFSGLPGMILEMDINEGERKIIATDIELKELTAGTIVAPKKGKKVTREQFDKIQKEKMDELRQEHGGSGNGTSIIIRG